MYNHKRLTVFTPTYNRAHTLSALYESLKGQSTKSFLWLIVDDGSTDGTEDLVKDWVQEGLVEIRYFWQANAGKARAHNRGVELCDTELFICVDSDDFLTHDAVSSLLGAWDSITDKDGICGVVALKQSEGGNADRVSLPDVRLSRLRDLYHKYGFRGEVALMFRVDVLRRYPFHVADGEKFMGEEYIYNQIDQHHTLYLLNKVVYRYAYLPDGYSRNIRHVIRDNPRSYIALKRQAVILSESFWERYKATVGYCVGCLLANEHPISGAPSTWMARLAYPLALLIVWTRYRQHPMRRADL